MPRLQRTFLLVCIVAASVAAAILLFLGDTRGTIAAMLVLASAILLLVGGVAAAPRTTLGIVLLGGAFALLGFPIALVVGAAAGLFIVQLVARLLAVRTVGQITLERLPGPAIMPNAGRLVRQFEADGFRSIGAFRFRTAGQDVILTVMAGADNDRLAVVTDKVWQVVSRFGARTLLTTNSAVAPMPDDVLRQHVAGEPPDIIRAHDAALRIVGPYSGQPEIFASDSEALDAVQQMEERALAFIRDAPFRSAVRIETAVLPPASVLGDDQDSLRRINAWIGAQTG